MNKQMPAGQWILVIQPVFTCSKSTVETPEQQGVKAATDDVLLGAYY